MINDKSFDKFLSEETLAIPTYGPQNYLSKSTELLNMTHTSSQFHNKIL